MIPPDTNLMGRMDSWTATSRMWLPAHRRGRISVSCLTSLLAAILVAGCVDLKKPVAVEECAAAGNCSDDPSQHPKRDANDDVEEPGPDSLLKDAAPDTAAPDKPIADTPTE